MDTRHGTWSQCCHSVWCCGRPRLPFALLHLLGLLPLPPLPLSSVLGLGPRVLCTPCKRSATQPTPTVSSSFPGHSAHRPGGANKPRTAKAVRQLAWWLLLPSWLSRRPSRRTRAQQEVLGPSSQRTSEDAFWGGMESEGAVSNKAILWLPMSVRSDLSPLCHGAYGPQGALKTALWKPLVSG